MSRVHHPFIAAAATAVLLVISFPNFNQPWCAWFALVPWLLALRNLAGRAAFWWSWLIGVLFFLGSLWWLIYVTVVGWVVLCAYVAIYFGVFGMIAHHVVTRSPGHQVTRCALIAAAWVGLEYLRSHLLSGFGWNLLAYSQTRWVELIQVADLTGAWGVSFLIVLVNVALAHVVSTRPRARGRWRPLVLAVGCLAAAVTYGVWRLSHIRSARTARIAVVQGNIPQEQKWDAAFVERILTRYETLTREAEKSTPSLIVWPETAVPGLLWLDEKPTTRLLALAKELHRPLLVGAPAPEGNGAAMSLHNSAVLVDGAGRVVNRYDKLHLVPLGEFIPGEQWLPWLRMVLPPIGDFTPGTTPTVFRAETVPPFSVLICFEDIFPELARRFVREGAQMLFVITNDAWFGPSAAAYQHAQASTFRAVELRVPVVRAANTGWSGCIDPAGRWFGSVHDVQGKELFVAGTHTCDFPLGAAQSLYLRWGDWFTLLCLGLAALWFFRTRRIIE